MHTYYMFFNLIGSHFILQIEVSRALSQPDILFSPENCGFFI